MIKDVFSDKSCGIGKSLSSDNGAIREKGQEFLYRKDMGSGTYQEEDKTYGSDHVWESVKSCVMLIISISFGITAIQVITKQTRCSLCVVNL